MLHTRIIPVLTLKDGRIIKTVKFDEFRDIGHPATMGKVFESQDVDELIFVDISASQERREPDYKAIESFAEECTMPLTLGGGVNSINTINRLLRIGADKVVLNSSAIREPKLISEASSAFGSQCIIVAIDAKAMPNGKYQALIHGGSEPTGLDVVEWAKRAEALGAGEIFLTSIDRDGTMEGYDLALVRSVSESLRIPVIANGGCGMLIDLVDAVVEGKASAVACSSLFAFTDNKPIKAQTFMQSRGINVRPI